MEPAPRVLLTGASGYVGGRLLPVLAESGHPVRAFARAPGKLELPEGVEPARGGVVEGDGLEEAFEDVEVAYSLPHSMGGGSGEDFAERARRGAQLRPGRL